MPQQGPEAILLHGRSITFLLINYLSSVSIKLNFKKRLRACGSRRGQSRSHQRGHLRARDLARDPVALGGLQQEGHIRVLGRQACAHGVQAGCQDRAMYVPHAVFLALLLSKPLCGNCMFGIYKEGIRATPHMNNMR